MPCWYFFVGEERVESMHSTVEEALEESFTCLAVNRGSAHQAVFRLAESRTIPAYSGSWRSKLFCRNGGRCPKQEITTPLS